MRGLAQCDVFKILCYFAGSLVMAAVLSPWLYNAGMGIAEVTEGRETNSLMTWLGDAARRSEDNFARFFNRALMLSAVVLLFPLGAWLRLGRGGARFRDTPWSLRLPQRLVASGGQPLERNPRGVGQLAIGLLLSAGLLLISGWLMVRMGFFVWRDAAESARGVANPLVREIDWLGALRGALITAVVVSIIEEVLFRGVLLGIFLRAMRVWTAIIALSLLFAFVHFLKPPPGEAVPDPEALDAGFVLLGQIFARFADPQHLLSRFSILFAVGVVLAVARYRTASLWLPFGLHAGWIIGLKVFKSATWPVSGLPEWATWLVGGTLLEGLLPLAMVGLTGVLVVALVRSAGDGEADDG
jgi:membrane protease YdiL (CAAX protease family)